MFRRLVAVGPGILRAGEKKPGFFTQVRQKTVNLPRYQPSEAGLLLIGTFLGA
jgi:hypothetical protein